MAISRAVCFSVPIPLLCCSQSWNRALVVLDSWDGFLPWQTERHRFALRHHPLLWEVSWALEQFLQSLPIIGLIPISIVTSPQRNLWLWLTSWNLPPHWFLIPGLMFLNLWDPTFPFRWWLSFQSHLGEKCFVMAPPMYLVFTGTLTLPSAQSLLPCNLWRTSHFSLPRLLF